MAFTLVEITGEFKTPSNVTQNGKLQATLSRPMQNGTHSISTQPIKATFQNGKVSFDLYANDDAATLPTLTYYTFRIEPYGAPWYEFKTPVPHEAVGGKIDITQLYENSGVTGIQEFRKPQVQSNNLTVQELAAALNTLGIISYQNEGTHELQ